MTQEAHETGIEQHARQSPPMDIERVLCAATALTGSGEQAREWMQHQPISEYGYLTALQLVEQGRAQAVVDYIESISGGAAG